MASKLIVTIQQSPHYMPPAVFFISYRVADAADQAEQLYNLLADRYRPEWVFRDARSLEPGQLWPNELKEKVNEAEAVIVLIRDVIKWLGVDDNNQRRIDHQNDWVRKEIETALNNRKIVIPVMFNATSLHQIDLPASLGSLSDYQSVKIQAEDLHNGLHEGGVKSLINSLDKIVARFYFRQDELFKAMKILKTMDLHTSDEHILVLTMSRLTSLEKEIREGIISEENIKLEKGKIRYNIINLLDKYC